MTICQLLYSLSDNGTEMMTPLPVPIHNRLHDTSNEVIRTKENPNLPVPEKMKHYNLRNLLLNLN